MSSGKRLLSALAILLIAAGLVFYGNRRASQPMRLGKLSGTGRPPGPPPPPREAEVREKIRSIFGDAVSVANSAGASYFAGDFNGDGSQDLAVIVRPNPEKLGVLNREYANWIREDPIVAARIHRERLVHPVKQTQRIRVEADDLLLAVIHGYGPDGWRNPEARQTYLLRHAIGEQMNPQPFSDVLLRPDRPVPMANLRADVVTGRLDGKQGFLYWSGADYGWYP